MIEITAFKWVPPFAQGQVRDLRPRWALEEAGRDYAVRLIGPEDQKSAEYRACQPFGQVPLYREDDLVLFESGAMLLRIAETSDALMPADDAGRERARMWVFAALNSIEPSLMSIAEIDFFAQGAEWATLHRPDAIKFAASRLKALSRRLDGREWLEDRFTVGDLTMATVLRIAHHTDLVSGDPVLAGYLARCTARPAFARALEGQCAAFREHAPAAG